MDLYSSLRVVQKRWRIAVPLLVLTLIGVAVAVSQSSSSKKASGEVVLLAAPTPPGPTNDNPNPPIANNPYALMELPDVVDVVSQSVSSEAAARDLQRQGLSGTYTIAGNQDFQRGPIMTIEVTSPTESSALASYRLVVDEAASTLDRLQDEVQANPAFRVKMQRLTAPTGRERKRPRQTPRGAHRPAHRTVRHVGGGLRGRVHREGTGPSPRCSRRGARCTSRGGGRPGSGDRAARKRSCSPSRLPTREPTPSPQPVFAMDGGIARQGEDRTEDGPRAGRDEGERTATGEDLAAEQAAARRRERAARRRASAARRRQAEAARTGSVEPAGSASATNADGGNGRTDGTSARKPRPRKPKVMESGVVATDNGQDGHPEERAAPREGS